MDYKETLRLLDVNYPEHKEVVLGFTDDAIIRHALSVMAMVQEGSHKVVPVEPTEDQIKAFEKEWEYCRGTVHSEGYKAMIQAAPSVEEGK